MEKTVSVFKSSLLKFTNKPYFPLALFLTGVIVALIETIYLLLLGNSLENAVWPLAIRNLELTFTLRESVPSVAVLCALILSIGLWLMIRRQQKKSIPNWIGYVLVFISGLILGLYAVFVIMDLRYLRGAFLLLPTVYGFVLFSCAIGSKGIPNLPKSNKPLIENFYSVTHLFAVFLAAWLMMPGIPALVGMAPSPPDKPVFGYGADPGPFSEVL
ncbi:MAG: hypothetical protein ACPGK2_04025, partial [Candidatus Poseidoniaceae archaeon]